MTQKYYTSERNQQILISLMKAHNIRKIVASPGTTNITFVGSVQGDKFFEIYSSVDERSACYIACGLAAESGEPVALTCTGATASRNYLSGLTEAFYRKLPVLAITASQHFGRVGRYSPQMLDRSSPPKDCVKYSAFIPAIHTKEDEWAYSLMINEALLELRHNGGGPVHLNMMTEYSSDFSVMELPEARVVNRITHNDELPELEASTVGIFVGAHQKWDSELTDLVDTFCEKYNGAVLCDHPSNYRGKYEIHPNLVPLSPRQGMDILIHIGEVSGAYMRLRPSEVWRVSSDGMLRDPFRKLRYVFEMSEHEFFAGYVNHANCGGGNQSQTEYYSLWRNDYDYTLSRLPDDLPFSNAWIARNTVNKLPDNSVLHLGILNSLRVWNFFELPKSITTYCNTGGFGIDGCYSALIGASLASPDKLFFGVMGDLAFFYDMNSVGNRHVGKNLRIMMINNGCGTEFKNYHHPAMRFGDDGDPFMAARGHFGNQSRELVKHYASDLGFEYLSASNKEEYLANIERFTSPNFHDKPIFFEIFTDPKDESDALYAINNVDVPELIPPISALTKTKLAVRKVIGNDNVNRIKKIIGGA